MVDPRIYTLSMVSTKVAIGQELERISQCTRKYRLPNSYRQCVPIRSTQRHNLRQLLPEVRLAAPNMDIMHVSLELRDAQVVRL